MIQPRIFFITSALATQSVTTTAPLTKTITTTKAAIIFIKQIKTE